MRAVGGVISFGYLLVFAWSLPLWLLDDGVNQYQHDPTMYAVAQRAVQDAWMHNDNPIGRLLMPAARVVSVTKVPGHCPSGPGADQPYAEYRARVRYYTVFAIPAATLYVSCGGWRWSKYPPAAPALSGA